MLRVDRSTLEAFATALIEAFGAPPAVADAVAESLVTADCRGHGSHGTRHLAGKYYREIGEGRIDPAAEPTVADAGPTWAKLDGNRAFGQLVGRTATSEAVERAAEHGVGVATLKRTSHIGRVGEFAELAADAGMIFTANVCNPGSAWVAPAGSAQRRFSTNPIAIGIPTFDALPFPFVMDIATSQVAHGKIRAAAARGDDVPGSWLVDDDGSALTDPQRFENDGVGALRPLGGPSAGYKGFNLSVMNELMAANLADGTVSGANDVIWGNHAVFTAIDVERFTSRERAGDRASAMARYVRETDFSTECGPGDAANGEELLLPGEYEHRSEQDHREHGVEMSRADARNLVEVAREVGVGEAVFPATFQDV
jgi:uncharacterized oxidoreductase